jgi:hypothetical protein
MPMPIKSSIAASALVFTLSFAAQSPAAAETLPPACSNGTSFIRNGIPYAHQCVTWTYGYGSHRRCTRWMPVMCGGGGTGNR